MEGIMVFKRRSYRKKPMRRRFRRIRRVKRPSNALRVYNFTRSHSHNIPVVDGATPAFYCNHDVTGYFSINQLTDVTDFTNLFDQYRLCGVRLQFIFTANSASVNTAGAQPFQLPLISWIRDYDDGSAPASVAVMEQNQTFKTRRLDKVFSVFVKPKTAMAVYKAGFTGYATPNGNPWIDCTDTTVQYYGIKFVVDSMIAGIGNNALGTLRISYKYYMQFKGVL